MYKYKEITDTHHYPPLPLHPHLPCPHAETLVDQLISCTIMARDMVGW